MRIHGVDNIAPQPLGSHDAVNGKILTTLQIRTRAAKRALAVRGMMEAVTWSFIPARHAELFGGGAAGAEARQPDRRRHVATCGPRCCRACSPRRSAMPTGASATSRCSKCRAPMRATRPTSQRRVAAGVRRGTAKLEGAGRHWSGNARQPVGVFDAKADAIAALEACGAPVDRLQIEAGGPGLVPSGPFRHDQARAEDGARAFRRVPPEDAGSARRVRRRSAASRSIVDAVPEPKPSRRAPSRGSTCRLPGGEARLRLRRRQGGRGRRADARGRLRADRKLITGRHRCSTCSKAPSLGEGKKSIAIEVSIQPVEKTLTDEDFEALAAPDRRERREADRRRAAQLRIRRGADPACT